MADMVSSSSLLGEAMRGKLRPLSRVAAALVFLSASGCGGVEESKEAIPGDSLAKANRSLATKTLETTTALAMATVPGCGTHHLINTEIVSVSEPLQIVGAGATQGNWVERWTYNICGATVPIKVAFSVDELRADYTASVGGVTAS